MENWCSAPDEVVFQNDPRFSVPQLKRYNSDTNLNYLAMDLGRVLSQESINRDELKDQTGSFSTRSLYSISVSILSFKRLEDVFPNNASKDLISSPPISPGRGNC